MLALDQYCDRYMPVMAQQLIAATLNASLEGKMAKNHFDYHQDTILTLYQNIVDDDGKTHRIEDLVGRVRALAETDLTYLVKKRREQLGIMPSESTGHPSAASKLSGHAGSQEKLRIKTMSKQSSALLAPASVLQKSSPSKVRARVSYIPPEAFAIPSESAEEER